MISIITVNWNADDFLQLLIESLERFSKTPYDLIVIDNSINPIAINSPNVSHFPTGKNIGHGKGLNLGVQKALELGNPYVMFLDCDCHMLKLDWEQPFLDKMKKFDIVAGQGPRSKPIRPACLFMKRHVALQDWSESEGYKGIRFTPEGYDVAIKAYYEILKQGHQLGFLDSKKSRYGTLNGEDWCINDEPLVYHHWHGSHLKERQTDFPDHDLQEDKERLFSKIPWRA